MSNTHNTAPRQPRNSIDRDIIATINIGVTPKTPLFKCDRCKFTSDVEYTVAVINDITEECPICKAPAFEETPQFTVAEAEAARLVGFDATKAAYEAAQAAGGDMWEAEIVKARKRNDLAMVVDLAKLAEANYTLEETLMDGIGVCVCRWLSPCMRFEYVTVGETRNSTCPDINTPLHAAIRNAVKEFLG